MDTAAALIAENAAFAELVNGADLTTPVPSCPDWTLRELMLHVGRGDRWSARVVAEESTEFVDPRAFADEFPTDEPGTWLHEGVHMLLVAVENTGPATPVWTFLGPQPARWWIRRRLHETLIHRADAALALRTEFIAEPDVIADAITEYLHLVAGRANSEGPGALERPIGDEQTLHLHATDTTPGTPGEWTVYGRPDGIGVDHEHARATTAVRGPARELLLALVRRGSATGYGLELFGDPVLWDTWLARTPL